MWLKSKYIISVSAFNSFLDSEWKNQRDIGDSRRPRFFQMKSNNTFEVKFVWGFFFCSAHLILYKHEKDGLLLLFFPFFSIRLMLYGE